MEWLKPSQIFLLFCGLTGAALLAGMALIMRQVRDPVGSFGDRLTYRHYEPRPPRGGDGGDGDGDGGGGD